MITLLSTVVILLSIFDANSQNACIWGRAKDYNDFINGEYTYQGHVNGAPWFSKQSQYHLWRSLTPPYTSRYYITPVSPTNDSFLSYARCLIQTDTPWECGSNWKVYNGSFHEYDANVYSQQGTCPEWDCDAIDSAVSTSKCNDIFSQKVGPNAWMNSAGNWYFYFHPLAFRWLCDDEYKPNTFNVQIGSSSGRSVQGWTDISKKGSMYMQFAYPCCNNYYLIKCTADPTLQPTIYPSVVPTLQPTAIPTLQPTVYPTAIPTINPTRNPSLTPSNKPTLTPTNSPTIMPSNIPTVTPTFEPTEQPTNDPTRGPSNNPTHNWTETDIEVIEPSQPTLNQTNEAHAGRSDFIHSLSITMYVAFVLVALILSFTVCGCICGYTLLQKRKKTSSRNANNISNVQNVELTKQKNLIKQSSNSMASGEESRNAEKLYSVAVGSLSSVTKIKRECTNADNSHNEDILAEELFDSGYSTKGGEAVASVSQTRLEQWLNDEDLYNNKAKQQNVSSGASVNHLNAKKEQISVNGQEREAVDSVNTTR